MSLIVDGTTGVTFNDSSLQGAAASPYVLKNRIINGDMRIDQRNAGASVTPTTDGQYSLDRWRCSMSVASKFSVQQQTSVIPTGFSYATKITSLSAYTVGSGDYFSFDQMIEGYNVADLGFGTANAKTITISFWVYSSLTGTFGASLMNSASNRSYPFTYTISNANTWEQKSVTIAGDTSGTWLTTNGTGLFLRFGLGVGSTYSGTAGSWAGTTYVSSTGATSLVGTNGATWYVTGVQLEIGSTATPFERRLYNQELANCQRYYEKCGWDQNSVPGSTSGYTGSIVSNFMGTASSAFQGINWMVIKRTAPTLTFYGSILGATETSGIVVDFNSGNSLGTASPLRIADCGYGHFNTTTSSSYGALYRVVASAEL
jgi:hypothetical protein